ncbi:hypothetical protein [Ornithinimicrobium murale]|uniref:hypothetical protein n=1 Tax=Ornithinimicrobium murale TaxID=1050153 RepID=UPI000E0D5829|nr:hypothetical protein [Ornithinimicrobium murale]
MSPPKIDVLAHRGVRALTGWLARRASERGDVHGANHLLLALIVDGRNHPTCCLAHRRLTREDLLAAGATPGGHDHSNDQPDHHHR